MISVRRYKLLDKIYGEPVPEDLKPVLARLVGCADDSCVVTGGTPARGGQHTNGGCHCLGWLAPQYRRRVSDWLRSRRGGSAS
jgi:hypothetical protein